VLRCKDPLCGSFNIRKNGTRVAAGVEYQQFYCNAHGGYAGKARVTTNGKFGKMS